LTIDAFWQEFLACANLDSNTQYYDCSHFHYTEEWANKLLQLVLLGQKTATTSSLLAYEHEGSEIPKAGNYSIVTDWDGTPHCVIKTTSVTILSFNEMTFDICKREGEDECLETWRDGHRDAFTEEGRELGYEFTEDMLVVFEDFEVVFIRPCEGNKPVH